MQHFILAGILFVIFFQLSTLDDGDISAVLRSEKLNQYSRYACKVNGEHFTVSVLRPWGIFALSCCLGLVPCRIDFCKTFEANFNLSSA